MRESGLIRDAESFLKARVSVLTESMVAINQEHLGKTGHIRQMVSDWLGTTFQQYREDSGLDQPRGPKTISSTQETFVESPRSITFEDSWRSRPSPASSISTNYSTACGLYGPCGHNMHLAGNDADSSSHGVWPPNQDVLPPANASMRNETHGIYDCKTWFDNTHEWTFLPAPDEQSRILPLQLGPEFIVGDNSPGCAGIPALAANLDFDVPAWVQPP